MIMMTIPIQVQVNFSPSHWQAAASLSATDFKWPQYHVRSEPGAWVLVAVLPHYSIKAAKRAGRAEQGPAGYRRRKVHTLFTLDAHCAHLAHFFTWCARSLDGVHGVLKVLSKFVQSVQSSQKVCSLRGSPIPRKQCAHRVHTGHTWCTPMILFVHTMHTLCTFLAKVCS